MKCVIVRARRAGSLFFQTIKSRQRQRRERDLCAGSTIAQAHVHQLRPAKGLVCEAHGLYRRQDTFNDFNVNDVRAERLD